MLPQVSCARQEAQAPVEVDEDEAGHDDAEVDADREANEGGELGEGEEDEIWSRTVSVARTHVVQYRRTPCVQTRDGCWIVRVACSDGDATE